jgi:rod shape-determining protein MreD
MGNFLSIPILAIAAALQASLIPQIRILSGGPDLVFLLVLTWAINSKLEEGVIWAFAGGIMLDLLSYNPTGTSVLGLLILVFAISGLGQQVYRIGFITLVGLVLAGTIIHQLVIMLILFWTDYPIDWALSFSEVVAPTAFYNLIFIWPIYGLVRRLQNRLDWSE